MIAYDFPLWRPPSEGDNLIIQATLGCSFNRCSFCSMYRTKEFTVRPLEEVFADVDRAAALAPGTRRVFLADGDALVCDTDHLMGLLEGLHARLPELGRMSSYALPLNLIRKSEDELRTLREAGLKLLYFGIESGSADILRRITKGATPDMMAEGLEKARSAGMKVSATIILGLGGRTRSAEHVAGTLDLIARAPLTYLSTLQLRVDPSLEQEFARKFREPFEWQDDAGILDELRSLVAGAAPPRPVIFRSNHASNALALAGNLPRDRDRLVDAIDAAQAGRVPLRPPHHRLY